MVNASAKGGRASGTSTNVCALKITPIPTETEIALSVKIDATLDASSLTVEMDSI
jgi:hypothetical protein